MNALASNTAALITATKIILQAQWVILQAVYGNNNGVYFLYKYLEYVYVIFVS